MGIYLETVTPQWRGMRADSFSDLLDYLDRTPNVWPQGSQASLAREYSGDDYGTASFGDAMKLARNGWKAGRDLMAQSVKIGQMMKPAAPIAAYDYDIGGAYPDVALYCAGEPAYMVTPSPESRATKPIYRFVINPSMSGSVSGQHCINRGAAILACAEALESQGARVEIVMLRSIGHRGYLFSFTFPIKKADEPFDIDKLAFCLAHPSMLRRLGWGMSERCAVLGRWFEHNHWNPSDKEPPAWSTPNSVYFGALRDGTPYATMADAVKTVETTIKAGINKAEG